MPDAEKTVSGLPVEKLARSAAPAADPASITYAMIGSPELGAIQDSVTLLPLDVADKAVGALGAVPAARGERRGEEKQPGDGASRQLAKSGAEVPAVDGVTAMFPNPTGGVLGGDSGLDPLHPAKNRAAASAEIEWFVMDLFFIDFHSLFLAIVACGDLTRTILKATVY